MCLPKPLLSRSPFRFRSAWLLAGLTLLATAAGPVAAQEREVGPSGLPLPRFVSLSAEKVNVRMGPSRSHKVKWTFLKRGLPVEVVREFDNWRRVRDVEGEQGWVHHSLLSGARTALVSPGDGEPVELRTSPAASAPVVARLEPFVLTELERCDGSWCAVSGRNFSGHVPQAALWGVYPREALD